MDFLHAVLKPKLIIQGTRDEFGPRAQVESFYESLAEPKQIHWVQNADHFFAGKLEEVQRAIREYLLSELVQVEESRVEKFLTPRPSTPDFSTYQSEIPRFAPSKVTSFPRKRESRSFCQGGPPLARG
jgi:hypothetical protein